MALPPVALPPADRQEAKMLPKSKNPTLGLLSVKSPSKMSLTPQWLQAAPPSEQQKPKAAEPN